MGDCQFSMAQVHKGELEPRWRFHDNLQNVQLVAVANGEHDELGHIGFGSHQIVSKLAQCNSGSAVSSPQKEPRQPLEFTVQHKRVQQFLILIFVDRSF